MVDIKAEPLSLVSIIPDPLSLVCVEAEHGLLIEGEILVANEWWPAVGAVKEGSEDSVPPHPG